MRTPGRPSVPGGKAAARLAQFRRERGLDPRGTESGDTSYLDGVAVQEQLAALATAGQPRWRPLGPYLIPHGQTYGAGPGSRPAVSGRISSLAIDPGDDKHLLAGSGAGGIWESRDQGVSWSPQTDDQKTLTVGAIAFDPDDAKRVWAGTGEGNGFSEQGLGLLLSQDGGTHWCLLRVPAFAGRGFYRLVAEPKSKRLWAATTAGLFLGGKDQAGWERQPLVDPDPKAPAYSAPYRCWDVSLAPQGGEVLAASEYGVWTREDTGKWTPVTLPDAPGTPFVRAAVCHAPADGGVAYVFIPGGDGPQLWRRDAGGQDFHRIATLPSMKTDQGYYDWVAAVAPDDPETLYLGAFQLFKGTRGQDKFWRWANVSARATGGSIHPDQHAIAFDPQYPQVVYAGNDGGLFRSVDGGGSWSPLNRGLAIAEVEYLAQHPLYESWLLAGTQDNGTLRYEGGEVWTQVDEGDGGDCGVDAAKPSTCYHSLAEMGVVRSDAGGGSATFAPVGPPVVQPPYVSLFYPPLEVAHGLVAQAGKTVFISGSGGGEWSEVELADGAGRVSALAIASPERVFAGTDAGDVYRIDFTGGQWQTPLALAQPRAGYVSSLAVDARNGRLWATFSDRTGLDGGSIYRSDDGGRTWSDVSIPCLGRPVHVVELDPAKSGDVYAGTEIGVFRSHDEGGSWAPFGEGLPKLIVGDLLFHARSRLLRAATRSRGVWEVAVDETQGAAVEIFLRANAADSGRRLPLPADAEDPFNPGQALDPYDSPDLKVAPSWVDLPDFGAFAAHDECAVPLVVAAGCGLAPLRIFVQAHQRGHLPASQVVAAVFFAAAGTGPPPDLPANFWTEFPAGNLGPRSPWQRVAPPYTIPQLKVGEPRIAGFDWAPAAGTPGAVWLLAVINAPADPVATAEIHPLVLVDRERRAGLRKVRL
jgi:photosystem II stability/assembly factor-like uncharacterized protein